MEQLEVNGTSVNAEFVLYLEKENSLIPLVYSVFDRSEVMVRGFLANVGRGRVWVKSDAKEGGFLPMKESENYVSKLVQGMERFCHGLAISGAVGEGYVITSKEELLEDMYSYLMHHFELPLMKEWMPYLMDKGKRWLQVKELQVLGETEGVDDSFCVVAVDLTQEQLSNLVSKGLKGGSIRIGQTPQKKLCYSGLDEYFKRYGHTIVDNLKKKLEPLSPLKNRVEEAALLHKRLYPLSPP